MTTLNAVGFLLLGLVMLFMPSLFPTFFVVTVMDGSNTSALWLMVMGAFQAALGVSSVLKNEAVPLAIRLMTLKLPKYQTLGSVPSSTVLRPLAGVCLGGRAGNDQRLAA